MVSLFAQPYDITASGFYFKTLEEYQEKLKNVKNDFGQQVEEFEFQFIDGSEFYHGQKLLDCLSLEDFFEISDCWKEEKIFKLECFIELEGTSNLEKDLWSIERQIDDITFYKDKEKNNIYGELFETYYPELQKYLDESYASNFFDEESFLDQNLDGSIKKIGDFWIYLNNAN